jgi:nitric oxide dioxygenase
MGAPPAGEFFLGHHPERPVVLLSGGVGLAPMVSMLETTVGLHPCRFITSVERTIATRTRCAHASLREMADSHRENIGSTDALLASAPVLRRGDP